MALEKVTYTQKKTVITAKNLNDIQDAVIDNENAIKELQGKISEPASSLAEATVE